MHTTRSRSLRDGAVATAIAVTSGKGGVGKTSLATNLGLALGRQGHRVCLLDADMGLANVNILLGLRPTYTVEDLLAGSVTLDDVMLAGPEGLCIIPAASDLRRLGDDANPAVKGQLQELQSAFDYLIVDTPAGKAPGTLAVLDACDRILLTVTQEPTSLTDAFTLLKAMQRRKYAGRISVIVNMLPPGQDGARLFSRFQAVAERHPGAPLDYLGHVPMDGAVTHAVLRQRPVLIHAPDSAAADGVVGIGARLTESSRPRSGSGRFASYWWADRDTALQDEPAPTLPREHAAPRPAEIITPPRSVREAAPEAETPRAAPPLQDATAIAAQLQAWLGSPNVDEAVARKIFTELEQVFSRRFRRRVSDIKAMVYEALLQNHLSREQHRQLVQNLFTAYRQRYGNGYRPDARAETLDQLDADTLITRLESLGDRLDSDPGLAMRVLDALLRIAIGGRGWSREESLAIAQMLNETHALRDGEPLFDLSQRDQVAALRKALAQRAETLGALQNTVAALQREHENLERGLDDPNDDGDHHT